MCETMKKNTISNTAGTMKGVSRSILERAIKNFHKADPEFGDGIAKALGFPSVKSRLWSDQIPKIPMTTDIYQIN